MCAAKGPDRPAAPAATVSSSRWVALLVVAVCLAYANTIRAPFIFDDSPAIESNQTIRQLWPLGPVLHPPHVGGTGVAGRPIVNLTLAVNYAISGLDPWSYHVANILVHAFAAVVLFALVRRTLTGPVLRARWADKSDPVAFGIAWLWALHPLQTETVACVIQRTESLVGLLYLLTLYGFARAAAAAPGKARAGWSAASIAACALGMATKEVMVTAPVIALLYDRTFVSGSWRGVLRQRGLHYGLIATWAVLFYLMQGNPLRGGTAGYDAISPWQYLLTQCRAVVLYLKLSLWPHPLVLDYGTGVARGPGEVWAQALLLLALAGGTLWALRRRPVLGFLGAWFFVILAPSSSIVPLVTQTIAEHRVYLPLAAIVALGVGALAVRSAALVLPVCTAAGLVLGGVTLARNQLYRSPEAMWRDNLAKRPEAIRAYAGLAGLADRAGDFAQAAGYYADYLQVKPEASDMRFNFARDLVKVGRQEEALAQFEQILRHAPGDYDVRINYGACLLTLGRTTEAVRQYTLVLQVKPDDGNSHFNLAEALRKDGQVLAAVPHYRRAVSLKPDSGLFNYRCGDALLNTDQPAAAVGFYRTAVKLQPDLTAAWVNLGGGLMMLGQIDDAIGAYEIALRLKPDDPANQRNLAFARSQRRR